MFGAYHTMGFAAEVDTTAKTAVRAPSLHVKGPLHQLTCHQPSMPTPTHTNATSIPALVFMYLWFFGPYFYYLFYLHRPLPYHTMIYHKRVDAITQQAMYKIRDSMSNEKWDRRNAAINTALAAVRLELRDMRNYTDKIRDDLL